MRQNTLLLSGLIILAAAWLGPLPSLAVNSFSMHMIMHISIMVFAAPLLAAGLVGHFKPLRSASMAFAPLWLTLVDFFVVWAWHTPMLHHAARQSAVVFAGEQASFLIAGLLLWLSVLGGERREHPVAGIAAFLFTSMHMTLLGVLLAVADRPLFTHTAASPWGRTPVQDQQLGGVVMLGVGGSVYLMVALYLLAVLLRGNRLAMTAAKGK